MQVTDLDLTHHYQYMTTISAKYMMHYHLCIIADALIM